MLNRRGFLFGLGTAPLIVAAANIMPIKLPKLVYPGTAQTFGIEDLERAQRIMLEFTPPLNQDSVVLHMLRTHYKDKLGRFLQERVDRQMRDMLFFPDSPLLSDALPHG